MVRLLPARGVREAVLGGSRCVVSQLGHGLLSLLRADRLEQPRLDGIRLRGFLYDRQIRTTSSLSRHNSHHHTLPADDWNRRYPPVYVLVGGNCHAGLLLRLGRGLRYRARLLG